MADGVLISRFDSLLPPPLAADDSLRAIETVAKTALDSIDLQCLIVYHPRIVLADILPHLARQLHVMGNEGWAFVGNEDDKRELIARAIELHRYKGTRWAVQAAVDAVGYGVELSEWFEYGGEPYCFRADFYLRGRPWPEETWARVYDLIREYKNARSHLEYLRVHQDVQSNFYIASAMSVGATSTIYPPIVTESTVNYPHRIAATTQSFETTAVYPEPSPGNLMVTGTQYRAAATTIGVASTVYPALNIESTVSDSYFLAAATQNAATVTVFPAAE